LLARSALRHLPYSVLAERIAGLPPPPKDEGRVVLVVARPAPDERVLPARCQLTPESGVQGDRWSKREVPILDAQVSVMRADVAGVLANGQAVSLSGDNLLVDLDLSIENLPDGTRLIIGTAVCVVTPKPHTGCGKFAARFGADARAITAATPFRDSRLRGLYVRVVEAGDVGPGDRITVMERGCERASTG
jgi:hypothetical protein